MLPFEEERAIAAVLYNYATGIDKRDWALFKSCFADDFVADYAPFGSWKGPDAMTAMMEEANKTHPATLHSMSNVVISGQGNAAVASCHVHAILMPMKKDDKATEFFGVYDDQLVKTAAGWKIKFRRFTLVK